MEINIHIECDNEAFCPQEVGTHQGASASPEIARILADITDKVNRGGIGDMHIRDINGNMVGYLEVTL